MLSFWNIQTIHFKTKTLHTHYNSLHDCIPDGCSPSAQANPGFLKPLKSMAGTRVTKNCIPQNSSRSSAGAVQILWEPCLSQVQGPPWAPSRDPVQPVPLNETLLCTTHYWFSQIKPINGSNLPHPTPAITLCPQKSEAVWHLLRVTWRLSRAEHYRPKDTTSGLRKAQSTNWPQE